MAPLRRKADGRSYDCTSCGFKDEWAVLEHATEHRTFVLMLVMWVSE